MTVPRSGKRPRLKTLPRRFERALRNADIASVGQELFGGGESRVLRLHVRAWMANLPDGASPGKFFSFRIQWIAEILRDALKSGQRFDIAAIRGLDRRSGKVWRPVHRIERGEVQARITLPTESWRVLEHFARLVRASSLSMFISNALVHFDRIRSRAIFAGDPNAGGEEYDWSSAARQNGVVFADPHYGDTYDPDADLEPDDDS